MARHFDSSLARPPIVFDANASRSISASAFDEPAGVAGCIGHEALDARAELFHPLPVGFAVQLRSAERIRVAT